MAAPPPDGGRGCRARARELQVGDGRSRLIQIRRGQDQPDPAVELCRVELSLGEMLAEQGKEPFAVGLTNPGPRATGHA